MTELITIASDDLTARINPFGAELSSLTDAAGREFMTDADPAFWSGRAPLLFPIVGALVEDTLQVDGRAYTMPKHGFARRSTFARREQSANRAVFRLDDNAETRASYPFAFALDMAFTLSGLTLEMVATVRNTGDVPLPFSFGYHPAFAWPIPGGANKAAHRVVFEYEEPQPIRQIEKATGLMRAEVIPTPVQGRELSLDADLFRADALSGPTSPAAVFPTAQKVGLGWTLHSPIAPCSASGRSPARATSASNRGRAMPTLWAMWVNSPGSRGLYRSSPVQAAASAWTLPSDPARRAGHEFQSPHLRHHFAP